MRHNEIPIVIISMNRLECLRKLLGWLSWAGYRNVIIWDNVSSYGPLLDFYAAGEYRVVRNTNAVSPREVIEHVRDLGLPEGPFVITDPDVVPCEACPKDVLNHFYDLLCRYPRLHKVGFGLRIDDLPDSYRLKGDVIKWESRFWDRNLEPDVYLAPIDTTFALYREGTARHVFFPAARTGGAFLARHLPWYSDSSVLSSEEKYYRETARPGVNSWNQEVPPSYTRPSRRV